MEEGMRGGCLAAELQGDSAVLSLVRQHVGEDAGHTLLLVQRHLEQLAAACIGGDCARCKTVKGKGCPLAGDN
ncbi:hypothetical protein N1030_01650 [Desulfovibrio mangrovi]|uniref:hypothetical protein n=1 Tax=Desulfovibrio mangrovi TaxID=2976983 RepID=UPI002247429F|nr:hypothetical protein [Desulfovibrio mangrovi]UZP67699.1 hypothetical protein N1030_01650 [Desulfovibrio mangrovi]